MSKTQFKNGDMVVATTSAQGLLKGETYEVHNVVERCTAFGTFVTYGLTGRSHEVFGRVVAVNNGHLLLRDAMEDA